MNKDIYLDNAATMPVAKEIIQEIMQAYQEDYANPSSLHSLGYEVEKKITKCKQSLAKILGVSASEIFFTSGGTESNNMALMGVARANKRTGNHILTVNTEHPSVLEAFRQLEREGFAIDFVSVDKDGIVVLDDLLSKLRPDTVLVSVMTVNNETGVIQPVAEIAEKIKAINPKIVFYSDCVQAFGKVEMPSLANIDMIGIGSHKIGGPKGIGLLYIKKGTKIEPLLFGGKHQSGLRPGTENYPLVCGFTGASEKCFANFQGNYERAQRLRKLLTDTLSGLEVAYQVNGGQAQCSPYILNLGFPNVRGEVLLHALETEGIYISTGSACQSKKNKNSHVLEAMQSAYAEGSVRISFGYQTEEEDVIKAAEQMVVKVKQLQRFTRK